MCRFLALFDLLLVTESNNVAEMGRCVLVTLLNQTTLQRSYLVYFHCISMSRDKLQLHARNEPKNSEKQQTTLSSFHNIFFFRFLRRHFSEDSSRLIKAGYVK
jgi:hypothetical protein